VESTVMQTMKNSRLFLVENRNETFHKGSANGSRTLIDTSKVYLHKLVELFSHCY